MLNNATFRIASFLCVIIAAGSAFGQASDFPYEGMINGTAVRVRAGRGDPSGANNYYYCAILNRPDKVTVVGAEKGWLCVLPPKGCYSVVLQSAVRPDVTGTKGTIIKREWARAAGTARTSKFVAGQAVLMPGDTVEIIGSVVDRFKFYKIKPPKNARYWIYGSLVDKISTAKTADGTGNGGLEIGELSPTTRPAGAGAITGTETETSGVGERTTAAPAANGVTPEQMREFKAIQAALQKEYGKPVVERDYAGFIERFKGIELEAEHPLIPFVNYYVKYLEADMERLAGILAARKLSTAAADAQREFDAARANVTVKVPTRPVTYDADGIVGESRMFTGTSAVRKRFILYVNKTHRLNAYVYTTNPMVDLASLVGKHVGVYGTAKYDPGLGAKIINVQRVEVITDQVGVPAIDKPVVRAVPTKPKPSETPITPAVSPRPTPPPTPAAGGGTDMKKPTPLIDLAPDVKPAEDNKPTPTPTPVPAPPSTIGRTGLDQGIEVVDPLPPGLTTPDPVEVARPTPVEVAKPAPVEIAKPTPVEVAKPVVTPQPIEVTKPKPVELIKPKPVEVAKPVPVEIAKPKPVEIAKPAPIEIAKPTPVEIAKPTPVEVAKPTPVEIAKPTPVEVAKPTPVEIAKPKPVEVAKPTPVEIAKPKPIEITKPTPIEIAKPTPIEITKPTPIEIAKPKPIEITKPTPIEIAKPKPIEITKPTPVEAAKPTPVEVAKPTPVEIAKPIPIGVAKPTPVEVAKPKPTVKDVDAATDELGGLIDLENIGKKPTTRPAIDLEAIPAPTKKVNPEDFPMPLPPSGLPLVDVKKTPTTAPVDTSEFD